MWFNGERVPVYMVPEKHPDSSPVMTPKLTYDERWPEIREDE